MIEVSEQRASLAWEAKRPQHRLCLQFPLCAICAAEPHRVSLHDLWHPHGLPGVGCSLWTLLTLSLSGHLSPTRKHSLSRSEQIGPTCWGWPLGRMKVERRLGKAEKDIRSSALGRWGLGTVCIKTALKLKCDLWFLHAGCDDFSCSKSRNLMPYPEVRHKFMFQQCRGEKRAMEERDRESWREPSAKHEGHYSNDSTV